MWILSIVVIIGAVGILGAFAEGYTKMKTNMAVLEELNRQKAERGKKK